MKEGRTIGACRVWATPLMLVRIWGEQGSFLVGKSGGHAVAGQSQSSATRDELLHLARLPTHFAVADNTHQHVGLGSIEQRDG